MKKTLLTIIAALLLGGVVNAQGWGENPDSHAQPSNTPIVASVTVNGESVTLDNTMRLGAFINDSLRGIAAPHTDGKFWIQVFYTATTDNITFKFYDGTTEYATCANLPLTGSDEGYGTPGAPQVLNFTTTQTMTQTSTLAEGWTWWSTPVEQNGINGLQILENSLGTNGVNIKGQNTSAVYVDFLGWLGDCPITNEASYMINVLNNCDVSMTGVVANPENHPITIAPNWNWIGYPVNQSQTIATALGNDFQPSDGDVIKGQNSSSVYLDFIGWLPADFMFTPGSGYMYYSNADSNKSLIYRNTRGTEMVSLSDKRHWHANYHVAEGNITLFGEVFVDDILQRSEDIELGAFVNGECRGSARLLYVEPIDAYYVIMTITGEEGDLIEFQLYNQQDGSVNTQSYSHLNFVQNEIVGEPNNPYPIYFSNHEGLLNLFPNPVERNQTFTLGVPQSEVVLQAIITDVTGNVISQKIDSQRIQNGISVSGIYFVKVICESGRIYSGKIIVE